MRLNPGAFAAFLEGLAEPFLYRKSFACPCLNPASGSPRANCPRCSGKGWLWLAPVDATAAVASSSVQLEWAKTTTWESGDLVLSIPHTSALYEVGQFDRVTALTNTDRRSVALVRGAPNERLQGYVGEIQRVFWLDDAGEIVEGAHPSVGPDGRLTWPLEGALPPAGRSYSITYSRSAEFFCFGAFSVDRMKHGGLKLPRKMVMRRFDLLGRSPAGGQA